MAEMVPRALVNRAAAGEVEAFERLLAPVVESAYFVALGLLEDPAAAEAAVVAASRSAFRLLRRRRDSRSLRFWFVSIVRRECQRRRRRARPSTLETSGDPGTTQQLRQAIGRLSFQERSLMVLHHYLGLSLDEVAALEKLTPEAARARLAAAAERLGGLYSDGRGTPDQDDLVFARRMQRLVNGLGGPGPALRPRIDRALRQGVLVTRGRATAAVAVLAASLLVAATIPMVPAWMRDAQLALQAFPIIPVASLTPSGSGAQHPAGPPAGHGSDPGAAQPPAQSGTSGSSGAGAGAGTGTRPAQNPTSTGGGQLPPAAGGTLSLADVALPQGEVGLLYGPVNYSAGGGAPPYQWSISPAPPPGLNLVANGSGARLQGTPSGTASINLTITVTDAHGSSQGHTYPLSVAAGLVLGDVAPPPGEVGVPYAAGYSTGGGVAPYTWQITSGVAGVGGVPNGASAVLQGTPTSSGPQAITVAVTDALGASSSHSYTVQVAPQLQVAASLPPGTHGQAYSFRLVTGGVPNYQASGLPGWLSLSPSGYLSGTPPAQATYSFTVTVTDGCPGCQGSVSRSLSLVSS